MKNPKVKDVKAIAEVLPEQKDEGGNIHWRRGYDYFREDSLNTELPDVHDCVVLDVEKAQGVLMKSFDLAPITRSQWKLIVKELANSKDCLRWKGEK